LNSKTQRFNSKFFCPFTENVDAFSCDWGNEMNWICPPISLIGKSLKHARNCQARGVLFVPVWKSAYYWPLLTPNGILFYDFIKNYLILEPYFISNQECRNSFTGFPNFRSVALYFDYRGII